MSSPEPATSALALASLPPSEAAFAKLMDALAAQAKAGEALALAAIDAQLDAWPDAARMWRVWQPKHPGWSLVRRLDLSHAHWAKPWRPATLSSEAGAGLTQLDLNLGWPKRGASGKDLCTGASFWPAAPALLGLQTLNISLATLDEVALKLGRTPGLRALKVWDGAARDRAFEVDELAPLTELRRLELGRCDLSDRCLPESVAVEELHLDAVANLGGLGGSRLERLRLLELTNLDLGGRPLPPMPALERLVLRGVDGVEGALVHLSDAVVIEAELFHPRHFQGLAEDPRLRALSCYFWDEPDAPAPKLGALSGLERLRCEVYMETREEPELGELRGLRELALCAGEEPTDSWPELTCDLDRLRGLTQLRALDLNRRNVANPGVLAELVKLERLDLHGCEGIESLDFLAKLERLEVLSLPSTVEDLGVLERLPKLRELRLVGPKYGDGEILEDWKLRDCSVLGRLSSLEILHIGDKDEVEGLDLSGCAKLRELEIDEMRKLERITGLESLPALRSLSLELGEESPYAEAWEARGLGWSFEGRAAVEALQAKLRETPI